MNSSKSRFGAIEELLLLCTLVAVVLVYSYFFLLLPQDFSLRDDYGYVLSWTRPGARVLEKGRELVMGLLSLGRFQPVDALVRMTQFSFLGATPRAFHATCFGFAALGGIATIVFLRRMGLSRSQILLALVLIASNMAYKEGLSTFAVSEARAIVFLMSALALYASGFRWPGVLLYCASFLTKESFFFFFGLFPILEWGLAKNSARRTYASYGPALVAAVAALGFVLFVRLLPAGYTSPFSFAKLLAVGTVAKSLVFPPLRSFGIALGLVAVSMVGSGRFSLERRSKALVAMGLWCIVGFSLFVNAWGPFDSWFYLHTPIPYGWAFVLGALWRNQATPRERVLLVGVCLYALVVVLNGSRNYYDYFSHAKAMARLACHETGRNPRLRVFSNCNEASEQLPAYLELAKACDHPVRIEYLAGARSLSSAQRAAEAGVIYSDKCDPFDVTSVNQGGPRGFGLTLGAWSWMLAGGGG